MKKKFFKSKGGWIGAVVGALYPIITQKTFIIISGSGYEWGQLNGFLNIIIFGFLGFLLGWFVESLLRKNKLFGLK